MQNNLLPFGKFFAVLSIGLRRAEQLAKNLCKAKNQNKEECDLEKACDSVNISITCDADARTLLNTGMLNGIRYYTPNKFMQGLCDTNETIKC